MTQFDSTESDQNPYQSPQADQEPVALSERGDGTGKSYARRKRNCLVFLIVWGVVAGVIYGVAPADWEIFLIFVDSIVFLIAVIQWTFLDAAERNFRLWRYFIPLMVFCPGPLVMMPVYFFNSRDSGPALKATALAFGFLLALYAIDFLSTFITVVLLQGL